MPDRPPPRPKPAQTPRAQAALEERRAREAAALRENLRRRKQQARDRVVSDPTGK
jgi:hypothetical protein